ncbi:MAG TPA: hypothetical protein VFM05_11275, partial [Candidatus Saccharimonadales bacterium]|nr:hypothetical protein [Candidatus Saccharimonadales bacterium]
MKSLYHNPPHVNHPAPDKFTPRNMKAVKQWVVWKLEKRWGKPTKVPYNSISGARAKSNDSSTWNTLGAAMKAHSTSKYSGIGFMFANGFAGVDLDECRNSETGEIDAWALEIVGQLTSYTEVSPSGCGLHVFIRGKLPGDGLKRNVNGHKIEIYDSGRFFTFTGEHVEGTPKEVFERQEQIESLYHSVGESASRKNKAATSPAFIESHTVLSDSEVMDRAMNARNGDKFERLWFGDKSGYASDSEADAALVQILCYWSQDDAQVERLWQHSGLRREKLESRADYRRRTIQSARSKQTDRYNPLNKPRQTMTTIMADIGSDTPEATADSKAQVHVDDIDLPISEDSEREAYLRRLWANHNRANRAVMMMAAALGFKKLPWRLLTALHGMMRNRLGVVAITNEQLRNLYTQAGGADSLKTVKLDKKKLWKAQKRAGIDLIWHWDGRRNPETGAGIASRYQSHLARWALSAVNLCVERYGYNGYRDEHLKQACAEIAATIVRQPTSPDETNHKRVDGYTLELKAEKGFE